MAYTGVTVNDERAKELFAEGGRTSEAVLQQAIPVVSNGELQHRLQGPADTGCAGVPHEQVATIDGDEVSEDEGELDVNAALPDEEFSQEALPTMHFSASDMSGGDMDELQAIRKVYAELKELQKAALDEFSEDDDKAKQLAHARARSLQKAVRAIAPQKFAEALEEADDRANSVGGGEQTALPFEAYAVHTGAEPLSMYSAQIWAMCFPHCFPYGDGVFGLPREKPLTFMQCVSMHLLREELVYDITPVMLESAVGWFGCHGQPESSTCDASGCSCCQCRSACQPFCPPRQPRWGRDRDLLCCYYDSWRRMDQIKRARVHVRRSGHHQKLERICNASAEKVDAAIACVGAGGTIRDVLRSNACEPELKEALAELMVFTTDVVGTDGARARLRHEQNGFCLAFGAAGGFLTPNLADVRSPLVVKLHGGGVEERYDINLLDENPVMPSAREMLQIIANDPVAQARFFIIAMRLFCEHVLGLGPFDDKLRHCGWLEGQPFPDGFAASCLGGAFGMIAGMHGPIEEQARLSIHPHILLWFVSAASEARLRSILLCETAEARDVMRCWQERVLAYVQSTQLDSAAVLPLLQTDDPSSLAAPRSTPFSERHQAECRFDGALEGDEKENDKRRPLVPPEELFVDHHIRAHVAQLHPGQKAKPDYLLPLTGAQVSKMPRYRLLNPMTDSVPITAEELRLEAALWREAYSDDYRGNIAVGQMHGHTDTCFKYVVQRGIKKAKHCRFHFCHFVLISVKSVVDGIEKVRDIVFARTGKDLVLPRKPGEPPPQLVAFDDDGVQIPLAPTTSLGPTVITDDARGMHGRIAPIRWNPLEGSSNGPAQVLIRGNVDYQSMMRTFDNGFNDFECRDELRDAPLSDAELAAQELRRDAEFEAGLPSKVRAVQDELRNQDRRARPAEDIEAKLRRTHAANQAEQHRGIHIGDRVLSRTKRRFKMWLRSMHVESMASSIAAMFYACDYSTKPNMTCAPLLVAIRDGIKRLEQFLEEERERERLEELKDSLGHTAARTFHAVRRGVVLRSHMLCKSMRCLS